MPDDGAFTPLPPRRGRGRPPFVPNAEQRRLVQVLSAAHFGTRYIALEVGVDVKTLKRAFREDFRHGVDKVKAAAWATLVGQATTGRNWGAAKYVLAVIGGPMFRPAEDRRIGGIPPEEGGVPIPEVPAIVVRFVGMDDREGDDDEHAGPVIDAA